MEAGSEGKAQSEERTLEMRVAELEDKLAKVQHDEEQLATGPPWVAPPPMAVYAYPAYPYYEAYSRGGRPRPGPGRCRWHPSAVPWIDMAYWGPAPGPGLYPPPTGFEDLGR